MTPLVRIVKVCLALSLGCLATASLRGAEDKSADQEQIEQSAEKFVAAYNDKKLDDLVALFADDAEMLRLGEEPLVGSNAIKAAITAAFEANPKAMISLSMDAVRFVTDDVAFEDGVTVNFADGETPTTRSRYTVVHVKRKGQWRMKLVRELEEEPLTPFARLRELEWMLGDWVDEGEDSIVKTSCKWNERKTFLMRSFEVHGQNDILLKGEQRIGWDPVARQVRSWTFDDAGGVVEGNWTQVDDRWVVKATGFRSDGQAASATQIVTSLSDGRMEWKMEERLIGDNPLPPITVILVRKPPAPAGVAEK